MLQNKSITNFYIDFQRDWISPLPKLPKISPRPDRATFTTGEKTAESRMPEEQQQQQTKVELLPAKLQKPTQKKANVPLRPPQKRVPKQEFVAPKPPPRATLSPDSIQSEVSWFSSNEVVKSVPKVEVI